MQGEFVDFGDAITFDTTHIINLYDKPLGMFVGANNHLQCTVFGFVLLLMRPWIHLSGLLMHSKHAWDVTGHMLC
jgi:hypothetical protein